MLAGAAGVGATEAAAAAAAGAAVDMPTRFAATCGPVRPNASTLSSVSPV